MEMEVSRANGGRGEGGEGGGGGEPDWLAHVMQYCSWRERKLYVSVYSFSRMEREIHAYGGREQGKKEKSGFREVGGGTHATRRN